MNKGQRRTRVRKKAMIAALKGALGIISIACEKVGLNRKTHYTWLREDAKYAEEVEAIDERALDFTEAKLFKLIEMDNPQAIFFHLKTRGKKRGYVEKVEQEQIGGIEYTVRILRENKDGTFTEKKPGLVPDGKTTPRT